MIPNIIRNLDNEAQESVVAQLEALLEEIWIGTCIRLCSEAIKTPQDFTALDLQKHDANVVNKL